MLYQILPKNSYKFESASTLMFLKSMGTQRKKRGILTQLMTSAFDYRFIIDCDSDGMIGFYFNVCGDDKNGDFLHILQSWCGVHADVFEAAQEMKRYDVIDTLYMRKSNEKKRRRLATYSDSALFMNIVGVLQKNVRITIEFKINKVSSEEKMTSMFSKTSDVDLEALLRVEGYTKYARNDVKNTAHKISNLTAGENIFQVDYKDSWKTSNISGSELLNILQLPTLYKNENVELLKRIQYLRPGQMTLKPSEFSEGVRFGRLYHPMQKERDVYVLENVLRTHMLITGTTGSGKTSAIEEQIDHTILRILKGEKNVPGFTFFDPAESSVLGVLDRIQKYASDGYDIEPLMKKVIYVDFRDPEFVFPISLINKNVDSNELIDFLNSLFIDANAIQAERLMNSAVNALLMADGEYSIFDIERLFNDELFRKKIATSLKKNMYASRELEFLESKFNPNMIAPILNRLDPFQNSAHKKLMFGMTTEQDKTKEIRRWMDEGYIVLFNIKGLNAFDIKTIVGYYVLQYYRTALNRPDFSLMHSLIIDESHKVQLNILAKVTAELRKQGLALVQMTQQMEQYNPEFLQKLIGNLNTIVSFRQNDDKAARNVKSFILSDIELSAFKTLPDNIGYVSTFDNDNVKKSVLIKVRPPYRYTDGRLVNYLNNIDSEENTKKNKMFAKEVMKRHMLTKEQAEKIVFKRHFDSQNKKEYEEVLLGAGDSYLSVEEGGKILWED